MPAQLSTIMYVAEYKEKTSSEYFVGTAVRYTWLNNESDACQMFNITVFYPCYVPKLKEGQILSIANSKFAIASDNELDVSLYSFIFLYFIFCIAKIFKLFYQS